jgi:hypothetical protein
MQRAAKIFCGITGSVFFLSPPVCFLWWAATGEGLVAHPIWFWLICWFIAGALYEGLS